MPITITIPNPNGFIGPGIQINAVTDYAPIQGDTYTWSVGVFTDADQTIAVQQFVIDGYSINIQPVIGDPANGYPSTDNTIAEGDPAYLQVALRENGNVVQSSVVQAPWTNQQGQWWLIPNWVSFLLNQQSQDLTSQQLQPTQTNTETLLSNWDTYTGTTLPSLQDMLNSILGGLQTTITTAGGAVAQTIGQLFSGKTLDTITTEVLGSACAPDNIDVTLVPAIWYGIQVHITTVPAWYAFTAPGENWTPRDLAVLTIYRGGVLVWRAGVHEMSYEIYGLPGIPTVPLELSVPITPPDYRVVVDFGTEVCGELVGLYVP